MAFLRPIFSRRWRRRFLIALATPVTLFLLAVLSFQSAVAWLSYPASIDRSPLPSTFIQDRTGVPLAAFTSSSGQWNLPLTRDQISPHLLNAIVATEDARFYAHHGVDWTSAAGAALQDMMALRFRRGASTITVQLYHLRDPVPRSPWGKLLQAIRACQIEKRMNKGDILVDYLNAAPFGGNLVGAGAASWRYFGRPCRDLSLGQAALLAGLPQSPNRFRPDRHPDRAKLRRDHVLDRMLASDIITPDQRREAMNEPIDATCRPLPQEIAVGDSSSVENSALAPSPGTPGEGRGEGDLESRESSAIPNDRYPTVPGLHEDRERQPENHSTPTTAPILAHPANADGLLPTLANLSLRYPGTAIRTTIDSTLQKSIAASTNQYLAALSASHITAAAVVVLDTPTGQFLAAGSFVTGEAASGARSIDLTTRPHSSGSTLKPFIYAAAFDAGICTPRTMLDDSPAAWAGYQPENYDRDFRGPMPAADALAQSRNLPALVLLSKVGVPRAVEVMRAMGLQTLSRTPDRYGLPLAIGGAEVTPVELAAAYATLARGGRYQPPTFVNIPTALNESPLPTDPSILGRSLHQNVIASPLVAWASCPWSGGTPPASAQPISSRAQRSSSLRSSPTTSQLTPNVIRTPPSFVALASRQWSPGTTGCRVVLRPNLKSGAFFALRPSTCLQTLNCLTDPDRTRRVCPEAAALLPAWKTGTSSGHRDAWCAAVTPRRTVIVWLGNPDNSGSDRLVGQDAAAPLALRIVTTADPGGPGFPSTAPSYEPSNPPPAFVNAGLTMLSPVEGQEIVRDPTIPAEKQKLSLRARELSGDSKPLWWFVDGALVAQGDSTQSCWWEPTPGNHELRVTDAGGYSAQARFRVR